MKKVISIVSGGMDSATLAYDMQSFGYEQVIVTFDYGQRHRREIGSAITIAQVLQCKHLIIDLTSLGQHLKGSALTDNVAVPHGHYAEESMRQTVVPNRNAIMLSSAWGIGVAEQADLVASAVHSGDHYIYPDCRPQFIEALNKALKLGTTGHANENMVLHTPYIEMNKTDICLLGHNLHVPFADTWTCYEGGTLHCGQCGACVERQEAFRDSKVPDPTVYRQPVAA